MCYGCSLPEFQENDETVLPDSGAMLEHLQRHVEAGHKVPQYAIDELNLSEEERRQRHISHRKAIAAMPPFNPVQPRTTIDWLDWQTRELESDLERIGGR